MQAPPMPNDEATRLDTLKGLMVLDTPPEEKYDVLTRWATAHFGVPIALVTLVDTKRQWFKSKCGLSAPETSRDVSFCGHAILSKDVFVIPDTYNDPRFIDNPLVLNEPKIRFYAGAPLITQNGQRLGTFCLIDRAPKTLSTEQINTLRDLANIVASEIQGLSQAQTLRDRLMEPSA